jgi:hypothetical protein
MANHPHDEGAPDAYGADPTRVARRSSRSVLAVASAAALVVAIGVVLAAIAAPDRPVAVLGSSSSAAASVGSTPAGSPAVRCHDVPSTRCASLARAALEAAMDPSLPPAIAVDVWASLLCGSTFDCPPARLAGHHPAGSAVIDLSGSLELWVNVTEPDELVAPRAAPSALVAWVIRSVEPD